MVLSVN
jgi:transposase